jgi:uncharacterized OB-fold protein
MSATPPTSPFSIYAAHCARGELAYQVRREDGAPVFHPRLVAPGLGGTGLDWRVSAGLGTVYATTTISLKGQAPYNVALVDLDEGFRMMSRVQGIAPDAVEVGLRVQVRFEPGTEGQPPYPVFEPAPACAGVTAGGR